MRAGFTLLELVFGVALAALIVGLAFVNARAPRHSAEARGLAEVVADELRLARQSAMARHIPVGVGIPSQNGSAPCSRSLYVLAGEDKPRLTRVVNFAGDFPGAIVAHASWALNPAALNNPSLGNSCAQTPPVSSSSSDYAAGPWLAGTPYATTKDCILIFTPSGTVLSNGAVMFDGDFHLMVSDGAEFGPGSPGNPGALAYFSPTRASHPYTISISPSGMITVVPGLKAGLGVPEVATGLPVANAAPAPVMPLTGNQSPVIRTVTLYPTPTEPLGAGVDVMVVEGQHATLRVEAEDPDGDELFCRWEGDPALGRFASANQDRMEWDPRIQRWVSTWSWYPADSLDPDDEVELTCRVLDRSDSAMAAVDSQKRRVVIGTGGRVAFHAWPEDDNQWDYEIGMVNLGGGERLVTNNETDEMYPAFSPDGSRIVFSVYDENVGSYEIGVMNYDGSGYKVLTQTPSVDEYGPFEWSPDGTRFAFLGWGSGWTDTLEVMCPDGTARLQIGVSSWLYWYEECPVTWAADSSSLVYQDEDGDLRYSRVDGSILNKLVRNDPTPDTLLISPHWSPAVGAGGAQLAFVESEWSGDYDEEIALITVDPANGNVLGGSYRRLFATKRVNTYEFQPMFDPAGARVLFESDGTIYAVNVGGGGLTDISQDSNSWNMQATWARNGQVVFLSDRVTAAGNNSWYVNVFLADPTSGAIRQLTDFDGELGITRQPSSLR
ncbi:MAG: hypothetical protein AB1758_08150 [Candidatus Eremiobacterota bacterium]